MSLLVYFCINKRTCLGLYNEKKHGWTRERVRPDRVIKAILTFKRFTFEKYALHTIGQIK